MMGIYKENGAISMEHIALMSKGGEDEDQDLVLSRNKHL